MKRLFAFLPFVIVAVIGAFFLWGLDSDRDPSALPSVLLDKDVPDFALEPIAPSTGPGLSTADFAGGDKVIVMNIFASWCVPCRAEHPVFERLKASYDIKLVGINYRDGRQAAEDWLQELGNPYEAVGFDERGRAGIIWGITGVPETFIISADGKVFHRTAGPILGTEGQTFVADLEAALGL